MLQKIATALAGLILALSVVLAPATALAQTVPGTDIPPAQTTPETTTPTSPTTPNNATTDPNNLGVTVEPVACGIELELPPNCSVNSTQGEEQMLAIIREIINVASLFVGAICVIMIIFGGFRYMVSGGESSGVTNAKNTILYAVVGLIVVLLAQVIVRFVFARATSATG